MIDRTAKFLFMCEKSIELQELTKNDGKGIGSWFVDKRIEPYSVELYCNNCHGQCYPDDTDDNFDDNVFWVWTQQQLQGFLGNYKKHFSLSMVLWEVFRVENSEKYFNRFESMCQLWLAIVMSQKFNKHWLGHEWVISK